MSMLNKVILIFCCLFFNESICKHFMYSFQDFFSADYSDETVQKFLTVKRITKEAILKEFLAVVEFEDDDENFSKFRKNFMKNGNEFNGEKFTDYITDLIRSDAQSCLENIISACVGYILETKNGKYLILKLLHLLKSKGEKIHFQRVVPGDGITTCSCHVSVDLSHLFTATDFYINNIISTKKSTAVQIEKTKHPDVYIFHELLHVLHHLENSVLYNLLADGTKTALIPDFSLKEENALKQYFPTSSGIGPRIDYEEYRTILGKLLTTEYNNIICENSYRLERKLPLRLNLLDASLDKK